MSKTGQKAGPRRVSFLLPGIVAIAIVVTAVAAILLSADPGGQQTSTTERPYVGEHLHSLAVDPTDPEKVMVGGHDGGAVSEDGGKTWVQASGLEGADPMGWVISPTTHRRCTSAATPASTAPRTAVRAGPRTTLACLEPTFTA